MADDTMTDAREASSGASPVVVPTPKSKGKKSTKAVSRPLPSSSLEHSGTPNAIPPTTPNKIRKPASKNGSATPGTVRKLNASSKASNSNGSDTPSKKGSTSAAKNDPATPTSKGASKDMATPPASIAKLGKSRAMTLPGYTVPTFRHRWELNKKIPQYVREGRHTSHSIDYDVFEEIVLTCNSKS